MKKSNGSNGDLDRALDAALSRTLTPPQVGPQLRTRMQAALLRAHEPDLAEVRSKLEREKQERLAELEANYVQLRRRTLGTIIGGAFAAGAVAAVAMPWLQTHFGNWAPFALASAGAVAGLLIALGAGALRGTGASLSEH